MTGNAGGYVCAGGSSVVWQILVNARQGKVKSEGVSEGGLVYVLFYAMVLLTDKLKMLTAGVFSFLISAA